MRGPGVVVVLMTSLLFAACGGGGSGGSDAVIGVVDTQLSHAAGGTDFAVADDGQPVAVGDLVRTDDRGFGEIRYADGSLVRLDVETTVEVLDLTVTDGQLDARMRMDSPGRSWHRVKDGVGGYVVETAVGQAAVRGTAFIVTCLEDDTCTVDVLEGSVEVTGAAAGQEVVEAPGTVAIEADGTLGQVEPLRLVDAIDDLWAGRNAERDTEQGFERVGGDQLATGSEIVGYWSGDWGDLVLREEGERVLATYSFDEGTITGRLLGGVVHGWWCEGSREAPTDVGPVQFRFVRGDDGAFQLDGRWLYSNDAPDRAWRDDWDLAIGEGDPPEDLVARFDDEGAFCEAP